MVSRVQWDDMPAGVLNEVRHRTRHVHSFNIVYIAMFLLSLHWAAVTYINSTYLERYISNEAIGTLYVIGSALTVLIFLFISRVLQKLGNYKLTVGLSLIELATLIGLGLSPPLAFAIPLFVIHHTVVPLILFNIDVFAERLIGNNESQTGGKRALLLTIMSIVAAVSVLVAGFLLGDQEPRFLWVYLFSAIFMFAFIYLIIRYFSSFRDPRYHEVKVLSTIHTFWIKRNLRFVFLAHFLLQLFFSWMVIYVPLYLATVMNIPWTKIGIVMFAGQMAYAVFEYPIGLLADKRFGEKEMMIFGFIILALSTGWISFIATAALLPWIIVMFLTRTGASFVEVTPESYFFKHTRGTDANVISFFRITRPLAFLAGALLGSLVLLHLPFNYMFIVLGALLLCGIALSLPLRDTK